MKDKHLVDQLKKGSEDAFDLIYYQYKDLVYFIIFDILKNHAASEEIMQDTFLKMYQSINQFDGRYFQAWLLKIAKNLAINRYHQEKHTVEYQEYMNKEVISSDKERCIIMMDLENLLDEDQYQVVVLTIIYRMKQKDIAKYLNKPLGTVSWLYFEALKKLRKYYKNEGGGRSNEQ